VKVKEPHGHVSEKYREHADPRVFLFAQCARIYVRQSRYGLTVRSERLHPHDERSTFGTSLHEENDYVQRVSNTSDHLALMVVM
jgi:hypothetical protein